MTTDDEGSYSTMTQDDIERMMAEVALMLKPLPTRFPARCNHEKFSCFLCQWRRGWLLRKFADGTARPFLLVKP